MDARVDSYRCTSRGKGHPLKFCVPSDTSHSTCAFGIAALGLITKASAAW